MPTPTPMGRPWPSEPVATSTQGSTGVGWPSMRLPSWRSVMHFLVGDGARRLVDRIEQRRGVPFGENQMVVVGVVRDARSRSADTGSSARPVRSAADIDEVGCPEPALVVQRMLSTRNCCASSCHWFSVAGSVCAVVLMVCDALLRMRNDQPNAAHSAIHDNERRLAVNAVGNSATAAGG